MPLSPSCERGIQIAAVNGQGERQTEQIALARSALPACRFALGLPGSVSHFGNPHRLPNRLCRRSGSTNPAPFPSLGSRFGNGSGIVPPPRWERPFACGCGPRLTCVSRPSARNDFTHPLWRLASRPVRSAPAEATGTFSTTDRYSGGCPRGSLDPIHGGAGSWQSTNQVGQLAAWAGETQVSNKRRPETQKCP